MIPEVINAIRNRHTTNLYDASRSLPDETIRELVDLATRAPSAFNLQNWRFLAVRSPEGKARLRQAAFNQAKVSETAVTFIMVGQLANHEVLPSRLAGSVAAGFMPEQVAAGWVGAGCCRRGVRFSRRRDSRPPGDGRLRRRRKLAAEAAPADRRGPHLGVTAISRSEPSVSQKDPRV